MKKIIRIALVLVAVLIIIKIVQAGVMTPIAGSPATTSYTLSDIYNKLGNLAYNPTSHSLTSAATPNPTFYSLTDIYDRLVSQTANLTPGNIRSTVTIMGVTGTYTGSGSGGGSDSLIWTDTFPKVLSVAGDGSRVYESGFGPQHGLCWSNSPYEIGGGGSGYPCNTIQTPSYPGHKVGGFYDASASHDGSIKLGAKEFCDYLMLDGLTVSSNAQHIWRLPNNSELFMKITDAILNGQPEPGTASYGGFRGGVYWTNDLSLTNYYTFTPSGTYDSTKVDIFVNDTFTGSRRVQAANYPREGHMIFKCVRP